MQKNMTTGSPFKLLINFTIPTFIGNIFQQFYLMADTLIVSRLMGVDALAAVGAVTGYSFMVTGFAQGLTMGFTAILGQRFGAGDRKAMKKTYVNSTFLSILVSVVVGAIFTLLSMPLLRLINTPENIIEMSNSYIVVIYIFLIFNVLYNFYSGVLRAMGDSRSPLIFMIISAVLNIILDVVSIVNLHLGVAGAALATVFSQGVAALLSFIYIRKHYPEFICTKEDLVFDWELSKKLLSVGMPGALQYSVTAISVIIVQIALNGFGSDVVAAYSCASKIESIVEQFYPSLGLAISAYAAQNLGKGEFKRIRDGFKIAVILDVAVSIIGIGLCYLIAYPTTVLFITDTPSNALIIENSVMYVKTISYFFIPLGSIFIFRTGSQGLGSGKIPMLSAFLELTARISTAFTLTKVFGFMGICLSNATSWIASGFVIPFFCFRYISKLEEKSTKSEHLAYVNTK